MKFRSNTKDFTEVRRKDGGTECLIGHYWPENVVALMCCWKITPSFADALTLIFCVAVSGRNLSQNTRDYAVLKT
jgi:hypothetical protein